jgi:tetratricopeptide (TPR) repeat protein
LLVGSIESTTPLAEQAVRLSPRDPLIGSWYSLTGAVHLLQSRTSEAIVWFEKARSANPVRPIVHADLASAYALKGETEHAVAELAEARRLSGDDRYASIGRLKAVGYFRVTKIRALYEATYSLACARPGCRRSDRPGQITASATCSPHCASVDLTAIGYRWTYP